MDTLSQTFAALADPTRRAIVARLAQGSATVKELSAPFDISGPAISRHLRVLERAGLISQGRQAQWRPCRLEPAPLKALFDWTEGYRRFWEESFDQLSDYLEELQANRPEPSPSRKRSVRKARGRKDPTTRAAKRATTAQGAKTAIRSERKRR